MSHRSVDGPIPEASHAETLDDEERSASHSSARGVTPVMVGTAQKRSSLQILGLEEAIFQPIESVLTPGSWLAAPRRDRDRSRSASPSPQPPSERSAGSGKHSPMLLPSPLPPPPVGTAGQRISPFLYESEKSMNSPPEALSPPSMRVSPLPADVNKVSVPPRLSSLPVLPVVCLCCLCLDWYF
jgi:hypothetical protein